MWRRLPLAGLLSLAIAGCYNPPEPDCGFVCGDGGACPPDYTCASDNVCHRNGTPPTLTCSATSPIEFDVASATATSPTTIAITFSAPPDPTSAATLANYSIANLALTGTPRLAGNIVSLDTALQADTTYTATVANVTRASDGKTLGVAMASFPGLPPFDVASAVSIDSTTITVTFDAPPDATATDFHSYAAPGLTFPASPPPMLTGTTVTLATSTQSAIAYTVTVTGVKRVSDQEPLATTTAMFTGRAPFDVSAAASTGVFAMTVTFDAPPDLILAGNLANYNVPGLALSGTPSVNGSTVTIATAAQTAGPFRVTVTNVARASDGEPLTTATAMFAGTDHCGDIMQDGDETDVDCGGATCSKCGSTKKCMINGDCASGVCQADNTCQ
jgi:hypothetical protein